MRKFSADSVFIMGLKSDAEPVTMELSSLLKIEDMDDDDDDDAEEY